MAEKQKIWVLTREHNDYDQHGAYFVAAFIKKPSHAALAKVLSSEGYGQGRGRYGCTRFPRTSPVRWG